MRLQRRLTLCCRDRALLLRDLGPVHFFLRCWQNITLASRLALKYLVSGGVFGFYGAEYQLIAKILAHF